MDYLDTQQCLKVVVLDYKWVW